MKNKSRCFSPQYHWDSLLNMDEITENDIKDYKLDFNLKRSENLLEFAMCDLDFIKRNLSKFSDKYVIQNIAYIKNGYTFSVAVDFMPVH